MYSRPIWARYPFALPHASTQIRSMFRLFLSSLQIMMKPVPSVSYHPPPPPLAFGRHATPHLCHCRRDLHRHDQQSTQPICHHLVRLHHPASFTSWEWVKTEGAVAYLSQPTLTGVRAELVRRRRPSSSCSIWPIRPTSTRRWRTTSSRPTPCSRRLVTLPQFETTTRLASYAPYHTYTCCVLQQHTRDRLLTTHAIVLTG
jgi:hypothetical protein